MQNRQNLMHFEQENSQKPHFGPFLALIEPILGPKKLFSALRPPLPLDITCLYTNLRNWPKLMHFEHGNGQIPYFGPLFGPEWAHLTLKPPHASSFKHFSLLSTH